MNLDAYFRIQADPVKCSLARLGPRAVTTDEKFVAQVVTQIRGVPPCSTSHAASRAEPARPFQPGYRWHGK